MKEVELNFPPLGFRLCFSSVQFSHSVMSDSLQPHESQHARPPCPLPTPGVHSESSPSSQWCHPAISSSITLFSFCFQSFPIGNTIMSLPRWKRPKAEKLSATLSEAVLCAVLSLWDPLDCSPPGSSFDGIPEARILECVAISSSRGSS